MEIRDALSREVVFVSAIEVCLEIENLFLLLNNVQVLISSTFYARLFFYENALGSFSGITVWLCDFLAKEF